MSHHALVVDDNHTILFHASEILEEAGFATYTAFSAEDAIGVLENSGSEITLLFTDVVMTGPMDGFELARQTAARWPHIGILVASGERSPDEGQMPEGAIFVAKPFSAEIIYDQLHQILPDDRKPAPLQEKP